MLFIIETVQYLNYEQTLDERFGDRTKYFEFNIQDLNKKKFDNLSFHKFFWS